MAYATVSDVRNIVDLTTDDITDDDITSLISLATAEINGEMQVYVHEEEIEEINDEKENDIDGSNTTFYTKNFPLGDTDNSGAVDTGDLTVWKFDSDQTRTEVTVTNVDSVTNGKFTLSEAVSEDYDLKVTYTWVPLNINLNTPNALIKKATAELTAAMAYSKLRPQTYKQLDTIDVVDMPDAADQYRKMYKSTLRLLKSRINRRKKLKETELIKNV